jgi:DNA-directed RNA polymerase specialized sigma24 family protein
VVLSRSENDGLIDALGRLPDRQAEVIALAYFGKLSHSEITKQLALPKGTGKRGMRLGLE